MIGGTVDMVKRQIEEFLQVLPSTTSSGCSTGGSSPATRGCAQLELFATEVMPEFGIEVPQPA